MFLHGTKCLSDLIGIPWKYGGRSLAGVDCGGLALLAQSVLFGRDYSAAAVVDTSIDYETQSRSIFDRLATIMERKNEICHGDILVFRFASCIHTGTYLDGAKILHIHDGGRSRISPYTRMFRDRLAAIYRRR